ncbi:M48 family metallopeptidase [Candidatus Azambacteria bacterium]|nr:M48 family metallopeptidase [Candidatus Azambacteria bacterium]
MTGFLVFVILIGFVFAQAMGDPGILYIFIAISVVMNLISYWYSDKLVLAMSRAKPVGFKDNPELYRAVENLTIAAGLPVPKIYIIDDAQPNAFATGRDPKHAVVAVTRGLLERLNNEELEGVIAHELSHIGNRDMLVSTMAVVLVGFVAYLSDFFLRSMYWGGRSRERNNQIQAIFMIVGVVLAIAAPIVASLLRLAISRRREFLADASGALLTRYPAGLATALEKISSYPSSMAAANHATSHLYIANPFRGKNAVGFFTKLFMTHPPIEERVKALRDMSL